MPALREMRRVLRPGGKLLVAEARTPRRDLVWRLLARAHGYDRMARMAPHLEPLAAQAGFAEIRTGGVPPWLRYVRGQARGRHVTPPAAHVALFASDAEEDTHMADRPTYPGAEGDTGVVPDRGAATAYPGAPRWVKTFGIAVLLVVLLVAAVMVASGGEHGPGRHMPSGGAAAGQTPPAGQVAQKP